MAMGGVGEAMLLGAAMGGGTSALMGRDPLKGALIGGLTGGAGAGISSGISSLAGAEGAALGGAGAGGAAGSAGITAGAPASSLTATSAPGVIGPIDYSLASATPASTGISGSMGPGTQLMGSGAGGTGVPISAPTTTSSLSSTGLGNAGSSTPQTFSEGAAKFAKDPMASLSANKGTAAMASIAAMRATTPDAYMPPEYKMKGLRWSENYRPAYAEGGIASLGASGYDRMVGEQPMYQAMARGGITDLGSYSDGGRMLKGPGDGMSDSIPANISGKRPARLADGEFVVPADVVSHLGNGSTDAGAKQLYHMMDKVRQARTGRKAQGREINARKYVPA